MYPIPPCLAAHYNNNISGLWVLEAFILVHYADVAAVDQRITEVSFVEINCTVDGRYSHSVAVVTDAGYNTFHNPSRMQDSFGYVFEFLVGRAETKYVCVGDGPCPHARSHRVTNDAANTRSCSAVRVKCGRAIMCFDLKTNC